MHIYDTVTDALADLKQRGFDLDFNLAFDALNCHQKGICLMPSEFEITEHYRFEGNTDPADESIVYAIQSKKGNIKGVLVSAYGTYSENISEEMIHKLAMNE